MDIFRAIDIDLDVHKFIEGKRTSFAETPNDVLRRELGLGERRENRTLPERTMSAGRAWSGKGVTLPHGTQLRMQYNAKQHFGEIDNGEWLVEGGRHNSPSAAAGAVARTKAGQPATLDGWEYWFAKRPSDDRWLRLDELRRSVAQ